VFLELRSTRRSLICVAACGVCLLLGAAPLIRAQHAEGVDLSAGQKLYQKSCTACHGGNAKGGRGPDLTTGQWRWGRSDDAIVKNIIQGIPGTEMPAFPMTTSEGESIVAYLHSLKSNPPDEKVQGDAAKGRELFFGSANCSRCHMFSGRGGRLGPDLSSIRSERGVSELREAILSPDKSLVRGYATVEATLPSGQLLRGVIKAEDTFSIQVMDENEKLHSLLKEDLRGIKKPLKSLMPTPVLTSDQVNDVLAFLKSPAVELPPADWKPSADLNVTFSRLKNARAEPQNWLTYWGDYQGTHYSRLSSIGPANVASLASKWTFQLGAGTNETVPIVVDGLMFVTGPLNNAAALDARTGQPIWKYTRRLPQVAARCTVMTNRGFAILGDRLYMGTLDTHLVSLDAKTGSVIWDVAVDDYKKGYSITHAPLATDGKILVGVTAGECALKGFLDAYDAATGKRLWRRWSIPQEGDPARSTWSGNSAEFGGSPTWMTGTYDQETDTILWPTGNPGPDYDGSIRLGTNLYSCSILALDPNTGNLKWYFQFTQHDTHDWDASETPVLIDAMFRGKMRKMLIHADRNAFYYVLDRETGQFLAGKAFAHQTWAKGLDDGGHPIVIPGTDTTPEGTYVCPDATGATNFAAPSYDPRVNLFFVAVREACAVFTSKTREPKPGVGYTGTGARDDQEIGAPGAIRALDPATGDVRWNFPIQEGSNAAGVLATAGGVVFAASRDGYLIGLDATNGKLLWRYQTGSSIRSSPMSYAVDGKQYVSITSGSTLITFGLPSGSNASVASASGNHK
jgi:PQQ-dependent dehydrogenase (methanol/ethanol family)